MYQTQEEGVVTVVAAAGDVVIRFFSKRSSGGVYKTNNASANRFRFVNRFHNLKAEESRSRKEQSFFVPVEEIRNNDYDLSINKYKEIEREKVVYDSVETILARLDKSETEYVKGYSQLVCMLEGKTPDGQG